MPKIRRAPQRLDLRPRRICLVDVEGRQPAGRPRRTELDGDLDCGNRGDGKEKEHYEQPTSAGCVNSVLEGEFRFFFTRKFPVRFGRRLAVARKRVRWFSRLFASDNLIWSFL